MRYTQSQRIWRAKYLSRNLWEQTKEKTPKKQTSNNSGIKLRWKEVISITTNMSDAVS
jgi:hypothetical protein